MSTPAPTEPSPTAAFFAALERRDLEACTAILGRLRERAAADPAQGPWCDYFAGILANERDNDWAAAEGLFLRAVQAAGDEGLRARALYALGSTYDYMGRWDEAIATFERLLALAAAIGEPIEQAKAWKHLAISYQNGYAQGAFPAAEIERAVGYCRQALAVLAPLSAASPHLRWLYGSVWNTLGTLHMNRRRWDEAIDCYTRDLAIAEELGDEQGVGISHMNLGEVYQLRGPESWPEAEAAYERAVAHLRAAEDRYHEADALANLAWLHQWRGAADAAIACYAQAIGLIEALRAGVSAEAARAGFFATAVDIYANAALLCARAGRVAEAFAYAERARSRAFIDLLAARSPELARNLEAPTLGLADVQAALPPGALLLEYFTTGAVEAGEQPGAPAAQRHRFPEERTLIFAVAAEAARVYDTALSPNLLRPQHLESVVERHFLDPATLRALYDRLILPAEELLAGRSQLFLAPHGPLHYIPFAALAAPDGAPLLRPGGPRLTIGPGASFLFAEPPAPAAPAPEPCLAVGYNGAAPWRLRLAEEEAHGVAEATGGRALAGPGPKKAALYSLAPAARLLHISCHGAFNPDEPLESELLLGPGERLTALEVMQRLRLPGSLVTLSACESGLSRVRRGDELVGLARAFLFAGAHALVATLWRVEERSTRLLVEQLYQELLAGARPAEALRRAQCFLMAVTRREARERLLRGVAHELLFRAEAPELAEAPDPAEPAPAGPYLKGGPGGPPAAVSLTAGDDDEAVFAAPYYWAPFILIGRAAHV